MLLGRGVCEIGDLIDLWRIETGAGGDERAWQGCVCVYSETKAGAVAMAMSGCGGGCERRERGVPHEAEL
jgi:hypothetical protein